VPNKKLHSTIYALFALWSENMKNTLTFILLLFSSSLSAECFTVTGMKTYWEGTLSNYFMNIGKRKNIEYRITVDEGEHRVHVNPSELICTLSQFDRTNGILEFTCGDTFTIFTLEKLESEAVKPNNQVQENSSGEYRVENSINNRVKEYWLIQFEFNSVFLTRYGKRPKTYNGIVRESC